jgi:hypothetical protein
VGWMRKDRYVKRDCISKLTNQDSQAHFGNCQSTELALARSVGIIAIEMMQNGISPITEKLVLKDPSRWSPEASNFLDIVSWATLKEIRDVR